MTGFTITFTPYCTLYNVEKIELVFRYSDAFIDQFGRGIDDTPVEINAGYYEYLTASQQTKADLLYTVNLVVFLLVVAVGFVASLTGVWVEAVWSLVYTL